MSPDKQKIEALKHLRAERKEAIARATGNMKFQRKTVKAIRQFLEKDAATVPQLAEGVGMPAATVLWFVAAMKKYGQIVEDGPDGSYYRYALVADADRGTETESAAIEANSGV